MSKRPFFKLQAAGNDFILIESPKLRVKTAVYQKIARKYCQRKISIGADGLLVIGPSPKASFKMRIFNPDGSEAEMCGNGARCAVLWAVLKQRVAAKRTGVLKLDTKAGIIESKVNIRNQQGEVRIKLTDPSGLKLSLPLKVGGRNLNVDFINTGVPHAVIFVEGLDRIDVAGIGRAVRNSQRFKPAGANVNFVEVIDKNYLRVRTYERGVEAETLACGTGCAASAIAASFRLKPAGFCGKEAVKLGVKGAETLRVYFDRRKSRIDNLWLEGRAYLVYEGKIAY